MKKIVSISVLSFLLLSIAPQASLAQISNQELPSKNKTERIENQKAKLEEKRKKIIEKRRELQEKRKMNKNKIDEEKNEENKKIIYQFANYYEDKEFICSGYSDKNFISFNFSELMKKDTLNEANFSVDFYLKNGVKSGSEKLVLVSKDILKENNQYLTADAYPKQGNYYVRLKAMDSLNNDGIIDRLAGTLELYEGDRNEGPYYSECAFEAIVSSTSKPDEKKDEIATYLLSVYGKVIDKKTGEGIKDAKVSCEIKDSDQDKQSVVTSNNGNYEKPIKFYVTNDKKFQLSCSAYAYGYNPANITQNFDKLEKDEFITDMNFSL